MIVSILARLAFDLAVWSEGKVPITFVCEEAHRYVPRERDAGFEPTKRIISRIAKEGRKYGISLCVVSQRPGDIDPTILSQCSTIFAMRLSNERDQKIVKSAVSDAAESLLRFLPSLGTRETITFGEGVTPALADHAFRASCRGDAQGGECASRDGQQLRGRSVGRRHGDLEMAFGRKRHRIIASPRCPCGTGQPCTASRCSTRAAERDPRVARSTRRDTQRHRHAATARATGSDPASERAGWHRSARPGSTSTRASCPAYASAAQAANII